LPITTIHNRIKKMEENGIIKGYTVVIDGKKLGIGIKAYILINVEYVLPNGGKISQTELAKKINKNPLVDETNILAGGVDIIIKIHSKDIDELNDFIIEDLRNMDGIKNTQTMIVLSEI
ncbi:MAG: Lrp/AsnC family transcriptional regulator, partial [Candidatus Aenigmarchaeota archaeon]|nr:Lrp/AsnC family transcriptional regulator [Candidatus Aenigmarchaeota archaeon]